MPITNRSYPFQGRYHGSWNKLATMAQSIHDTGGQAEFGERWVQHRDPKHLMAVCVAEMFKDDEAAAPLSGLTVEGLICICYLVGVTDAMELGTDFVHDSFGHNIECGLLEFEAIQCLEDELPIPEIAEQYKDATPAVQTLCYIKLAVMATIALTHKDWHTALEFSRAGQTILRRAEGGNHMAALHANKMLLQLESAAIQMLDGGKLL